MDMVDTISGRLTLDMVTHQELVIIIEVLKEFRDTDMEDITRDLLNLDINMDTAIHLSIKIVITITDHMGMK